MKNKLLTLTMSLMVFCTNADSHEQGQAQGVMTKWSFGQITAVCPKGTKVVSGGCASGQSAISVSRPLSSSVFEFDDNEGWMCGAGLCLDYNTDRPETKKNNRCQIRAFAVCQ
jgi:hypothetical protein